MQCKICKSEIIDQKNTGYCRICAALIRGARERAEKATKKYEQEQINKRFFGGKS